jgi:hypothetical protein
MLRHFLHQNPLADRAGEINIAPVRGIVRYEKLFLCAARQRWLIGQRNERAHVGRHVALGWGSPAIVCLNGQARKAGREARRD